MSKRRNVKVDLDALYAKVLEAERAAPDLSQSGIDGAEQFLAKTAREIGTIGDLEAMVYFASRRRPLKTEAETVIAQWNQAAEETLKHFQSGQVIEGCEAATSEVPLPSIAIDRSQVESIPSIGLPNFWDSFSEGDVWTGEPTLLRFVQWYSVGGFGPWWRRWANELERRRFDTVERVEESVRMFGLMRSDYALSLLSKQLPLLLTRLAHSDAICKDFPWATYSIAFDDKYRSPDGYFRFTIIAGAVAFASVFTADNDVQVAAYAGAEWLIEVQEQDGSWKSTIAPQCKPRPMDTAFAVHGVAAVKPMGWHRSLERAGQWLRSQQFRDGSWGDPFTTVLVADALQLIEGRSELTFTPRGQLVPPSSSSVQVEIKHRLPTLTDVEQRALDLIKAEQPILGKTLADRLDVGFEHLRRLLGKSGNLARHGVFNAGDKAGYRWRAAERALHDV